MPSFDPDDFPVPDVGGPDSPDIFWNPDPWVLDWDPTTWGLDGNDTTFPVFDGEDSEVPDGGYDCGGIIPSDDGGSTVPEIGENYDFGNDTFGLDTDDSMIIDF
jgi:hypothetical protein